MENHLCINDMPATTRPAYRLNRVGPRALSSQELLSIIVGSSVGLEVAHQLLSTLGSLNAIDAATEAEITAVPNLGPVGAARIKAAFEIGRRMVSERRGERPVIHSPADAADLLMGEMRYLKQEHVRLILLDTRSRVIATPTVYIGNVNSSIVRLVELFSYVIKYNAVSFILVHNHPSGDPSPSPEDINLTRNVVEAGKLLDVAVSDHIIIGDGRFVSLREKELGFSF